MGEQVLGRGANPLHVLEDKRKEVVEAIPRDPAMRENPSDVLRRSVLFDQVVKIFQSCLYTPTAEEWACSVIDARYRKGSPIVAAVVAVNTVSNEERDEQSRVPFRQTVLTTYLRH